MLRPLDPQTERQVSFRFEGRTLHCSEGISLAAALLASGIRVLRFHPVDGSPRAAYCMMGICQECLVDVEGIGRVQACQLTVNEGLAVSRPGERDD